jgi:hypothetical protein
MPWFAVLKNLPVGYDNTVQQVWFVGQAYRVSSYDHHTTAVHTPAHETTKEWRISKAMARRLFDKPYWEDEVVVTETPTLKETLQPYQLQVLDALTKYNQLTTQSLITSNNQIMALKREMEQTFMQGVDETVYSYGNLYDSQGNDRFHGY